MTAVVFFAAIALTAILVCFAVRNRAAFEEQFPPISDAEFFGAL